MTFSNFLRIFVDISGIYQGYHGYIRGISGVYPPLPEEGGIYVVVVSLPCWHFGARALCFAVDLAAEPLSPGAKSSAGDP